MRFFSGPNLYSTRPVVVERLTGESFLLHDPGRVERRLRIAFAGWLDDCPATDQLDPVHARALVTAFWCKGLLNSVRGLIESAGAVSATPGVAWLWVGYHVPELTAQAIRLAGDATAAAAADGPAFPDESLARRVAELQALCRRRHPDKIARILMLAAIASNIPVLRAAVGNRHWQFGWGCHSRVFFETSSTTESNLGHRLARDKVMTHAFLRRLGFPVTAQRVAQSQQQAMAYAHEIGWPVVVKPTDCGQGKGVTVGIDSDARLVEAFDEARRQSAGPIIVERVIAGDDHRLLVVRGKLVAVSRRVPPTVVGDDHRSVAQLAEALNRERAADPVSARYLKTVKMDAAVVRHLAAQGLTPESLPGLGERVQLRGNANIATGGSPTDLLARVHSDIREMAESIAANVALDAVGIDYISPDISRSWREVAGGVIEINASPDLNLHIVDGSFSEEQLGRIILGGGLSRIPLVIVIAGEGQQRQMLAALESRRASLPPGTVLKDPSPDTVGGTHLQAQGSMVAERVGQVLANVQCTAAVFCCSAQQIADHGFPVDRCALAVWRGNVARPDESAAFRIAAQSAQRMRVVGAGEAWPPAEIIEQVVACLAGEGR